MTVDKDIAESPNPAGSRRWWALAAVALGVSLIIMDATVVNVALPVVIEDIGLTATQAEWMNAVYSLMLAALLLTTGRAGDLWGRRRLLLVGMGVFIVASVAAGSVDSGGALIAARLVQGVGAAMILPATLSTVNAIFSGRERAIAFAVWGSTIGGMAAVGPLVGGWLTTDVTWRWAFWLNVPVGIAVLALVIWAVPETRDPGEHRSIDVRGAALSTLGMGAIVFALIEGGQYGWWLQDSGTISPVPIAMAAGLSLMALFVVDQLRRQRAGRPVLVDLTLLRLRSFRYGSIAALVVALGEFGLLFTLPLLLQNALGYSALGTGWLVLFLAIGTFLISGATPQLTARLGARAVVRIGLACEAIAVGGLALTLSADIGGVAIASWLFLYGAGVGMATAQLTNVILTDVPVAESGQASGLQSTFRQLGSALGVAILGTLLVVSLGTSTDTHLADAGVPDDARPAIVESVRHSAGAVIPSLQADASTEAAGDAAADGMITASRITTGVASAIILIGLAATLALPAPRRREDDEQDESDVEVDAA
ncbi:MFS transporter [Demequina salsinemoris]|uniref:MFS transporter n=1 Tax=Demequina salsinemoris TaxID=577470 RepID=UPI000781051A|nr:MFS transporter [Demequina salsinemoris]